MKLIQTSHVNILEPVLTIHLNEESNDWEIWNPEEGEKIKSDQKILKVITWNVWFGSHNYNERLKEQRKIF